MFSALLSSTGEPPVAPPLRQTPERTSAIEVVGLDSLRSLSLESINLIRSGQWFNVKPSDFNGHAAIRSQRRRWTTLIDEVGCGVAFPFICRQWPLFEFVEYFTALPQRLAVNRQLFCSSNASLFFNFLFLMMIFIRMRIVGEVSRPSFGLFRLFIISRWLSRRWFLIPSVRPLMALSFHLNWS